MASSDIAGVNWGSTSFRAYRIAADGTLRDERVEHAGISSLDRAGMATTFASAMTGWEGLSARYASGMIGSNVGWVETPYVECPIQASALANESIRTAIGGIEVSIIPGLTCRRADGMPDIMRGEEVEILGALSILDGSGGEFLIVLPGTHTKWVRASDGAPVGFFTAMSGELYDRLTKQGLLASVVDGDAVVGEVFSAGVRQGSARRLGLGTELFSVRARVIRGELHRSEAASFLRGLLIGSEFAAASELLGAIEGRRTVLVVNAALSVLYRIALAERSVEATVLDGREACVRGFVAIHESASRSS